MNLEETIREVIKGWNKNCKNNKIDKTYHLDLKIYTKKYYTTKTKFYEKPIAELIYRVNGEVTFSLYRKEIDIVKVEGVDKKTQDEEFKNMLLQYFLYECIGIFGLNSEVLIKSKDYAQYDFKNDRLMQDPEYRDCEIEITKDGDWYKKGDVFEVFTKQDSNWGVYSAFPEFKKNNYIGRVPAKDAKIIKHPKIKIESLEELGIKPKKIILTK